MPKFPKGFGLRKSTASTALEDAAVAGGPAGSGESTFKVFERPDSMGSKSFDGGVKFSRGSGPVARPNTSSHLDDDNMFVDITKNRGSGASNTNTASTTDNSSRLSAASTTPSSTDVHGQQDWKSPHDKPFSDIPLPPIPKPSAGFSLKNAGRTLSWGRNRGNTQTGASSPSKEPQSPAIEEEQTPGRSRAVTASSYASTATPPKAEKEDLGLSLGGDFGDMFSGFGKRKNTILEAEANRQNSQSPEVLPAGPATRSYTATRSNQPARLRIDKQKEVEAPQYSWNSQHSMDGLISAASPPPLQSQRNTPPPPPPPVPQHAPRTNSENPASYARPQRPGGIADNGLRRSSAVLAGRRQSTLDSGDSIDEDAKLLRDSVSASRRMNDPSSKARDNWDMAPTSSYKVNDATLASWGEGPSDITPRANKLPSPTSETSDDDMFDSHIAASANLAQRFQEQPLHAPPRTTGPLPKVMTPAQFERYKQDQERLKSVGGVSKDEEEEEEEETYDDDEDDAEKARQLAKQRRKQEAHMAVYRQQMMKVTGETPAAIGRPPVIATQSSPNLGLPGRPEEDGEEEDDEVPLAILQAHGFPSKTKPPMHSMGSNPNLRSSAQSIAGGVVAGSGANLPVFARNLPQDPYFGASVQNPMQRESLAFGGGAGSVSGAPSRGLPPGGLVGVIATEERSRAARRGSPNTQGNFGSVQPHEFAMGMQPPTPGMYPPGMGQMGPMGPMNPMMLTPGDQAQIQMTQQMTQFMAMQMQFMQLMTTGPPGQQNGHLASNSMGDMPRPSSAHQMRPGNTQQRSMSMLDPNGSPWMKQGSLYAPSVHAQGNGYAASIAPSERSNVGLPGRYRPVSNMAVVDKSRASTMSGALQAGWEAKQNGGPTIRAVRKSGNVSDEDDEEGWEEMKKKREKKKSAWRTKKDKDSNGLKEMLGFAQ